jgi:phytoene desaturase
MKSAIVIGAGIGGIATAARLSRQGYQVTVYEKQSTPGGRASMIKKDGYTFDTGPTLFLMPEVFAETYAALGERMQDHLDLVRIDPTYRIHFHDGSRLDLTSNLVEMRDQLEALEPGSFEAYLRFLAEGYRHYNLSLERFVGRNFFSLFEFFSPSNLPLLFQLKALRKHAANTARFFKDSRLQAAFSFQNMYLGLSPYDAPATFSLLQYTELADGVWFPKGGMYRAILSLEDIARGLGVRFNYEADVKQIIVEGNQAVGILLKNGEQHKADVIVANADLPYVYSELLPDDGTARKLEKKNYTSSTLMFYWGIRGERSPQFLHHNVFLADHQYKDSFESIFRTHTLPNEPSFYLNVPSRTEPSFAPPKGDGIMVLVPVGHLDESCDQDWDAIEARAKQAVLSRIRDIGVGNIAPNIELEMKWGPQYYRDQLNLAKGAAFGLSHNFMQVGYLRPHNRHPHYQNLYFVGASTHPGTGLPIVLMSARLTVERILNEQPLPVHPTISTSKPVMESA